MADQTVTELIKAALRKTGAIASGETPTNAEMQEALIALRIMFREWGGKSLMLFKKDIVTHTLDGSTSYTIGSGADIATTRPVSISSAFVATNGLDYPLRIIDADRYSEFAIKDSGSIPAYLWYNPGYSLGTIYIYPPGTGTLNLYCLVPLSDPTTLTEDVVLPGEYDGAIVWNLACEMSLEYGREPSPFMVAKAESAKDAIIMLNAGLAMGEANLGIENIGDRLDGGGYSGDLS